MKDYNPKLSAIVIFGDGSKTNAYYKLSLCERIHAMLIRLVYKAPVFVVKIGDDMMLTRNLPL